MIALHCGYYGSLVTLLKVLLVELLVGRLTSHNLCLLQVPSSICVLLASFIIISLCGVMCREFFVRMHKQLSSQSFPMDIIGPDFRFLKI